MTNADWIAIGIGVAIGLIFNFVPTAIAFARRHPERGLIARLNVLALVSLLLWLALFAWAIGGERNSSVINRFIGGAENRRRLYAVVAVLVGIGVATTTYALTQGLPQ